MNPRRPARTGNGRVRLQEQSLLSPLPPGAYGSISCHRCQTIGTGAVLGTVHGASVIRDHVGRLRPQPWSAVVSCDRCGMIAAVCQGEQYPPPGDWPGDRDVSAHVSDAYKEARGCLAAGCYTATAMMCRKILMNLGVDHGARAGRRYEEYVDWLAGEGYITATIKQWVEFVRDCGNKANHRPDSIGKRRAMTVFMLTTELVRRVYELEYLPDDYFTAYCEPIMDALPLPSTPAEVRAARDKRAGMCSSQAALDAYTDSPQSSAKAMGNGSAQGRRGG